MTAQLDVTTIIILVAMALCVQGVVYIVAKALWK